MALMMNEAGFAATHVPFNGSPPAAMALAQGTADASFMTAPALLALVKSGKVRMLATSAAQRPESLKDLPTLAEAGYPQVESMAWNGLFTAAGTPPAVVSKINADVNTALRDPAVKALLDSQGLSAVGGSPEDFKRVLDADARKWGAIIQKLGIKLDQ
jgi:tripartite-type tricarboxylate transporter receptor subunit TctC